MDWLALAGKVSTDGARADVARLRDLVGEIQAEHQKFSGSPAPIDFDAYRSSINTPGLVDQFEAAYNSLSFPTYANESAASALADFDARTAVWVDKCNANGVTEVFAAHRKDLPIRHYAFRGDFLFFLLGFKPACLIAYRRDSKEVEKLFIDTLLEDVWRPVLQALEDAGDVQFERIGWDCNPWSHISSDSSYSYKDALVVLNNRHKFADHARETFTQPSRNVYGGTLLLRFAKALDYPTRYSEDVEVEYRMDSPDYLMLAEYMTSFHGGNPTRFLKHFVQYRDAARPFGCDLKFVMGGIVIPNEIVELLISLGFRIGRP